MRAYRSCASARCGCRSRPLSATRWAASSWRRWRSSSPSRRNTRLCGSCASWAESALTSSTMARAAAAAAHGHPAQHLRGGPRLARGVGLRHLFLGARREPLPLLPLLERLGEAAHGDEREPAQAIGGGEQRIEALRAAQLCDGVGGATGAQMDLPQDEMHGRVVGLNGGGLFGRGAGALEVAAPQGVLRLRNERGRVPRRAARARLLPRIDEGDEPRALEPEQRLGDVEVRFPQRVGDGADVACAVDGGQHLPFRREQVQVPGGPLVRGGEHGDDAEMRDALLDAGPFVDAARPFHEERFRGNAHRGLGGDRKSTRLNSSHVEISYAVFCLKKKKKKKKNTKKKKQRKNTIKKTKKKKHK